MHLILPEARGRRESLPRGGGLLDRLAQRGRDPRRIRAPCRLRGGAGFRAPVGERRTRDRHVRRRRGRALRDRAASGPHERTHRGPKADRLALLRATHANLESIFLLAPDPDGALAPACGRSPTRPPDASAELDGVEIRLWVVSGAAPSGWPLAAAAPLYIADGHHRYETAVAYAAEHRAARRLLAFIVSAHDAGLVVLPTHRVIYAADRLVTNLETGWQRFFEIRPVPPPADRVRLLAEAGRERTACIVATEGGQRDLLLTLRDDAPLAGIAELGRTPAVRTLDVAIVERLVVGEILASGKSTPTLTYTPDPGAGVAGGPHGQGGGGRAAQPDEGRAGVRRRGRGRRDASQVHLLHSQGAERPGAAPGRCLTKRSRSAPWAG